MRRPLRSGTVGFVAGIVLPVLTVIGISADWVDERALTPSIVVGMVVAVAVAMWTAKRSVD